MKKTTEKYIYITDEGKYRVQIRPSKKIREKFDKTFDTINVAIDERDNFLAKQRLGIDLYVNKNLRFSELCDKYFEWFKNKPKKPSPNTLKDYNDRMNSLKRYFVDLKKDPLVYQITSSDIEDFLIYESRRSKIDPNHPGQKTNKKISSNTLHHEFVMLRILFNKAKQKWKDISVNPMDGVEEPQIIIQNEVKIIPYEEFEETIDLIEKYATIRDKAIFYLGLCGGLREEEICGIHCIGIDDPNSDINFNTNKVHIKHAIKQNFDTKKYEEYEPKSGYSKRGIPLPDFVIDTIKEYLKYRDKFVSILKFKYQDSYKNLPHLFLNQEGDYFRPIYVGKLWRVFKKKHGITPTFHGLRHTYITYQMNYNDALSPSEVQALAGHSNIQTTYKYVHKSEEKMKKATNLFDNIFNKKIDINEDNTLYVPVLYVASVVTGTEYTEINNIMEFLKYINPGKDITYANLSSSIVETREYLLANYPSLENMIKLNKEYSKEQFEDKVRSIYGNKFVLNINEYDNDYTKC